MMNRVSLRSGCVRMALVALLALQAGAYTGDARAQERERRSEESGRVESVSATPLSVTIDGRVYAVTPETHLRGRALVGEPAVVASTLRTVVGRDVGYSWFRDPGRQPVIVTIVPIEMER